MIVYYMGLDLGQIQDYTALVIIEMKNESRLADAELEARLGGQPIVKIPTFDLRHIERFHLGTSYPAVIDRLKIVINKPELHGNSILIVDQTGVGRPVVDSLRQENICNIIGVTIHGGTSLTEEEPGRSYHVPKRNLVSALQVLIQSERLKIAKDLEYATILKQEILNFRVKVNPANGHETFEAWREGEHDDLVLATAMASWYALKTNHKQLEYIDDLMDSRNAYNDYDPRTWGFD
jgi:hypothetical protein